MISATGELLKPTIVSRACLRCDEQFPSEGKHNRLCRKCQDFAGSDQEISWPEPTTWPNYSKNRSKRFGKKRA